MRNMKIEKWVERRDCFKGWAKGQGWKDLVVRENATVKFQAERERSREKKEAINKRKF